MVLPRLRVRCKRCVLRCRQRHRAVVGESKAQPSHPVCGGEIKHIVAGQWREVLCCRCGAAPAGGHELWHDCCEAGCCWESTVVVGDAWGSEGVGKGIIQEQKTTIFEEMEGLQKHGRPSDRYKRRKRCWPRRQALDGSEVCLAGAWMLQLHCITLPPVGQTETLPFAEA